MPGFVAGFLTAPQTERRGIVSEHSRDSAKRFLCQRHYPMCSICVRSVTTASLALFKMPAKLSLLAGQLFLIGRQISPYVRNILRFRDCLVARNSGVETATGAKR